MANALKNGLYEAIIEKDGSIKREKGKHLRVMYFWGIMHEQRIKDQVIPYLRDRNKLNPPGVVIASYYSVYPLRNNDPIDIISTTQAPKEDTWSIDWFIDVNGNITKLDDV